MADHSQRPDATPHADGFLDRMLSGFGHAVELPTPKAERHSEAPYRALRQAKAGFGATYRLQKPTTALRVRADSPATDVMTDLSRVPAVTIDAGATLRQAHDAMHAHRVRALFVVDAAQTVLGLVTSTDFAGERPIQIAQQRGVPHDAVTVRDVMTPAQLIEAMDFQDVVRARVGDIVDSLKSCGRQHALVTESDESGAATPTYVVRGIFSLTQIARQLGLPPQPSHDIARTFAEVEAAIGP